MGAGGVVGEQQEMIAEPGDRLELGEGREAGGFAAGGPDIMTGGGGEEIEVDVGARAEDALAGGIAEGEKAGSGGREAGGLGSLPEDEAGEGVGSALEFEVGWDDGIAGGIRNDGGAGEGCWLCGGPVGKRGRGGGPSCAGGGRETEDLVAVGEGVGVAAGAGEEEGSWIGWAEASFEGDAIRGGVGAGWTGEGPLGRENYGAARGGSVGWEIQPIGPWTHETSGLDRDQSR